jgi:lipopolysaccharide transport system permease protein
MARFSGVAAAVQGSAIHLKFALDAPAVIGWQIFDPATGAYLVEGKWSDAKDTNIDLSVTLPAEDGPYQVHVAPVEDRSRFILIEAHVAEGRTLTSAPRVTTAAALRRARLIDAIPKAFTYPVRGIWGNRRLIVSMVKRDILSRYRGSIGGAVWTFLSPLLMMLTYFFVFGIVMKARFGADTSRTGYVLYFLAGMLPWLAFVEAVGRSPQVIIEHRNFVKKLVFPVETLPVNLMLSGIVTEAIALVIFLVFLLVARGGIPATALWLPTVVIPQMLFTVGLCWILAALGVFLRDLTQITQFLLTLWFFLTPILYSEANLPPLAAQIMQWNPVVVLVHGYRSIFLDARAPDFGTLAVFTIGAGALAVVGHAWFHRLRKSFADVI